MKYTAEQYAKKHGITLSVARERLKEMYVSGSATRKRTGMIGGTFAYEILNNMQANDPFNLGAHHGQRHKTANPNRFSSD